jgi:hypothetical protein
MTAKELNEAFIEACEYCPQFRGFDENSSELVDGRCVNVANLHEKGIKAVLKYWCDASTIGGSLIHTRGYSEELPSEVINLINKVEQLFDKAISDALKTE